MLTLQYDTPGFHFVVDRSAGRGVGIDWIEIFAFARSLCQNVRLIVEGCMLPRCQRNEAQGVPRIRQTRTGCVAFPFAGMFARLFLLWAGRVTGPPLLLNGWL